MREMKKKLMYGVLLWAIPFVVSIFMFPIRASDRPLFESAMTVVVVLCVVIFSALYFRKWVDSKFLSEGIFLGILWLVISLAIDLILFMPDTPMHVSFIDYIKDIGITYLLIPVITIGFGYILNNKRQKIKAI
jgi:hypothetical protein